MFKNVIIIVLLGFCGLLALMFYRAEPEAFASVEQFLNAVSTTFTQNKAQDSAEQKHATSLVKTEAVVVPTQQKQTAAQLQKHLCSSVVKQLCVINQNIDISDYLFDSGQGAINPTALSIIKQSDQFSDILLNLQQYRRSEIALKNELALKDAMQTATNHSDDISIFESVCAERICAFSFYFEIDKSRDSVLRHIMTDFKSDLDRVVSRGKKAVNNGFVEEILLLKD